MRVEVFGNVTKIGGTSSKVPVAVVLTQKDKENIANMHPEATVYAAFPDDTDVETMRRWCEDLKERGA